MTKAIKLSFNPKQLVKRLLGVLPERAQDIMEKRYGLGSNTRRLTLEAIGEEYGITRERVRQVESFSLNAISRSSIYKKELALFDELKDLIKNCGSLVQENGFLCEVSSDKSVQNHIHFLLVVGDAFHKLKEDDYFHRRWTIDRDLSEKVHRALHALYKSLSEDEIISETEIITRLLKHLQEVVKVTADEEVARRWLDVSKKVKSNPLGDWGLADAPHIKMRGVRDYAYLVLRRAGAPMHFSAVAREIEKTFDRSAHVATTHNELIKDKRFVLVGRGLYALRDWGYREGIVRDIIRSVLKRHGPLDKERLIGEVLKERHVKPNTIVVNLQNKRYFKRTERGRYALV